MNPRWLVLLAVVSLACEKGEKGQPEKEATPSAAPTTSAPPVVAPPTSSIAPTTRTPRPLATSLEKVPVPEDNPLTDQKVALGHLLFFDKRLSVDGSRACYSCHQNEDGTGGHEPLAVGAQGKQLTRHSPALWNVGFLPALYWDGRAATLEEQATGAWAGGNMGVGKEKLAEKAARSAQSRATRSSSTRPSPERARRRRPSCRRSRATSARSCATTRPTTAS